MSYRRYLSYAALALTVAGLGAFAIHRASTISPTFADIAYADASDRNRLDVYFPDAPGDPQPLVILVHGGGFRIGSKERPENLSDLLGAGFAVAAINYRLSDEAIWPAQLEDVTAAIRFLHENAQEFGVDRNRMGIFGRSAGAHLAATATIALAAQDMPFIAAVVDWFAPIDFTTMDRDLAATGLGQSTTDSADSFESRLVGAPVGENPEVARRASPLHFLNEMPAGTKLPPFLIMHGALDANIAPAQSERLRDAIAASPANGGVEFELLPEGTHNGGSFRDPEAIGTVLTFLTTTLVHAR